MHFVVTLPPSSQPVEGVNRSKFGSARAPVKWYSGWKRTALTSHITNVKMMLCLVHGINRWTQRVLEA